MANCLICDKEIEEGNLSIRKGGGKETGSLKLDELLNVMEEDVSQKK